MWKREVMIISLTTAFLLNGCGSNDRLTIDDSIEEQTENRTENREESAMYEAYTGVWSKDGKTHDRILSEGGVELSCTITERNQFTGALFVQQEMAERFAGVEGISGEIEQNELFFDYSDDGWGNSGTLYIQFGNDRIYIEVLNYKEAAGGSDYGISGSYELKREDEAENDSENTVAGPGYDPAWMEDEVTAAINERSQYYKASAYYPEITDYWENVREVRDVSNVIEPLFETDKQYYTKEDFENEPALVIHLAKNEIYARHGYIFRNKDLYNYFMGCIWYSPTCEPDDFDDGVLNEYEKENLKILAAIDSY